MSTFLPWRKICTNESLNAIEMALLLHAMLKLYLRLILGSLILDEIWANLLGGLTNMWTMYGMWCEM